MEKGIFYVIMEEKAQREDVMVQKSLGKLVQYGLAAGLIQKEDKIYIMNTLLELLGMEERGQRTGTDSMKRRNEIRT